MSGLLRADLYQICTHSGDISVLLVALNRGIDYWRLCRRTCILRLPHCSAVTDPDVADAYVNTEGLRLKIIKKKPLGIEENSVRDDIIDHVKNAFEAFLNGVIS